MASRTAEGQVHDRWRSDGESQRGGLMTPADVKRAAVRPKSAADSCLTKATALPPLVGCPALLSWTGYRRARWNRPDEESVTRRTALMVMVPCTEKLL